MATLTSLVNPATGTDQGKTGDTLTLSGSDLGNTTRVNFGLKPVAPATVAPGAVTVTVPALCAGQHRVSVTAGGSTSNSLPFFFIAAPVCHGMSSNVGPAGATTVTIVGEGFLTATGVGFGSVGAATGSFPPPLDSRLTVTTPAHTTPIAGCTDTVDVTITSVGGTSVPIGNGCQYTFYDAPDAVSASPGTQVAGQNVTISGTCLLDATAVVFSDGVTQTPATFVNLSPTQIIAVVPAVAPGTYSLLVTTPGGTDTTAPPSVVVTL